MATKRRSEEHRLQAAVMEHYRLRGVRGALLFAIPNGGLRDKIVAAQLREEGVTAGVPDLWGRAPGRESFWLELKVAGPRSSSKTAMGPGSRRGSLSAEQRAMHAALTELGEQVFVAWGIDEALAVLMAEGVIRDG